MRDNRKEFVFVIGKSEKMDAEKMIEGWNSIAESQKKGKDDSVFTLVFFNDDMKMSFNGESLKKIRKYTKLTYVPKGKSALYDAIGYTMDTVGERLSNTPDCDMPNQVCMIIIGESDSRSTVYEYARVDEMIKCQKYIYKWDFVFYGDGNTRFDINKGGNFKNYDKMFREINDYITSLR
ncbi:MAG: hypothetical protein ACI3XA_02140 [Clostridia bacterium]